MFKNLNTKEKIVIVLFTSVCILIPWIMDFAVFGNSVKSNLTNGEWSSFLGSYAGGIISGVATLLAVIISLNISRKVQMDSELRENSLIVYYDLVLGLNDLKKLYIKSKSNQYTNAPTLMFFSNEWIKNVAKISSNIGDTSKMYKLYGDLGMINDKLKIKNNHVGKRDFSTQLEYSDLKSLIEETIKKYFSDKFIKSNMEKYSDSEEVELDIANDLKEDIKEIILKLINTANKDNRI